MPLPLRDPEPDSTAHGPASHAVPSAPVGDRALVDRIRAGDVHAFEMMFKAHYDALCRYIAAYLGSRDAAEDVVQGVFTRIWEDRARWDVHGALAHYLYAAVRRRAVSHLRHDAVRRRAAPHLTVEAHARHGGELASEQFEALELRHRFERVLTTLPPRTREAFVLSRREGLSYDEIALRMGISPKTVGVHIGRSLAVLRKAMLTVIGLAAILSKLPLS
jgi:RNA polymerase sigma-70 factor (ECF subfamily)